MAEDRVRVRDLAAATPASRDRYVDFLRAFAIVMVVVGHWLAVMITFRDGRLGGEHVLAVLPWTHWLTWLFQVMGSSSWSAATPTPHLGTRPGGAGTATPTG